MTSHYGITMKGLYLKKVIYKVTVRKKKQIKIEQLFCLGYEYKDHTLNYLVMLITVQEKEEIIILIDIQVSKIKNEQL